MDDDIDDIDDAAADFVTWGIKTLLNDLQMGHKNSPLVMSNA